MSKAMTALEHAQSMIEEDTELTIAEALHWLAHSQDADDLYVKEFLEEARMELGKLYPNFILNFWWKT